MDDVEGEEGKHVYVCRLPEQGPASARRILAVPKNVSLLSAVSDVTCRTLDSRAYDDEAEKHNDGYDGDQPGLNAELSKTRQFN